MRRYDKKTQISFTKILELIGKPAFFLFNIIVLGLVSYFHLLKLFVQQVSRFFSHLSPPQIPELSLHLPTPNYHLLLPLGLSLLAVSFYYFILKDLPSPNLLGESIPSLSTKIYDRHGTLLYQIYKDENRSLIRLEDLPKHVIDSTLAAEDKNFYHHFGIDPVGIARAATNNLLSGTSQGGSTITQQLIKNTLLTSEKTFTRKLKELVLALQTERLYTKDQILEMYLNQVGYGGTAYGIEESSWQYFGKSARDLSLAESAMLAGLPISPTALSPFGTNPYLGKIRQQQVLESMVLTGVITENDKVAALASPLVFHPQGISIRAPHFVMYVKDLLVKQFGESVVSRGGLAVTTTLDLNIQEILQAEINTELKTLKSLHVQNGAGMVVNPETGEILAMAGSHDFFDTKNDGQVNVTLQERQPGSSIKPITYALALSRGLTPSSTIDDSPICYTVAGQPPYCPKNYDGRFHGKVTLRTALASSYNIPATKLLNSYGLSSMVSLARSLGITTWEDTSRYGLSLTLGGGEIKMIDLASVYATFANSGTKIPFTPILSVSDSLGHQLPIIHNSDPKIQVIPESIAYQINSILSDPAARAPAFGINSILNLPGPNVAVKTGTTNALRDNWTFGYTPDLLVATWVGNNDNTPMSSVASGVTGASPIWARTMQKLLQTSPATAFIPPENLVRAKVSCDNPSRYEYFVKGTAPKLDCSQKIGTLLETAATTSQ